MGLFSKPKPVAASKPKIDAVEKVKLTSRLQQGKLKTEITNLKREITKGNNKIEQLNHQLTEVTESREFYKGLDNDRVLIDSQKKALQVEQEDLEEDKKLLAHRSDRLEKRAKRLEEEENDEYKKGYSDGLADGLRKAHDITREDRKYLTMIAMSTNQSEAIKTSQKALEGGFERADS
jgi:chromosome segregation ATPase